MRTEAFDVAKYAVMAVAAIAAGEVVVQSVWATKSKSGTAVIGWNNAVRSVSAAEGRLDWNFAADGLAGNSAVGDFGNFSDCLLRRPPKGACAPSSATPRPPGFAVRPKAPVAGRARLGSLYADCRREVKPHPFPPPKECGVACALKGRQPSPLMLPIHLLGDFQFPVALLHCLEPPSEFPNSVDSIEALRQTSTQFGATN